ncbi:MAG TPA: hypothetical protein VGW74_20850 [Propionibacteriaceae bacterium]|nr:hypothetical protein [Propionibacteriaceae bacterium]
MTNQTPRSSGPPERCRGQGHRWARRRSAGAIAAAIVTCVALGFAVPIASGLLDDQPNTPSGGGPWEQLPRPPANDVLGGPEQGSAVWTGRELVLLAEFAYSPPIPSGRPPDGLAYNPATGRWRALPEPPPDQSIGGGRVGTVWTGKEVILLYATGAPIAYDPDANTWTPIPALVGGAIAPETASAWTGSELIIWSATTSRDGLRIRNAARSYNPRSRRWRPLPPAPITPRRLAAAVWAGDRLVVWGGLRHLPGGKLDYPDDGAAYTPHGNRWRPLAKAPVPGRAMPLTVWTGDRAIFIGGMNLGDRPRTDRGNIVAIIEQGAAYRPAGLRSGG